MSVTLAEKYELMARYGMKAWAHILLLEQSRGRKLNLYQISCINSALGITPETQPEAV
ncbi:MAG: hypothetical protein LAD29_10545 [Rhodoferax sp.]|nr:hypothetical protein [Rhodoferax sp.]